jgi:hypothetical protein
LAAGVLVLAIVLAAALIAWLRLRRRPEASEIERQRRIAIHRDGKTGDGEIIDVEGDLIVYSYSVAGLLYEATQDAAALQDKLPADRISMVGPVSVKFIPHNPANSIVLCEEWTGLRTRKSLATPASDASM